MNKYLSFFKVVVVGLLGAGLATSLSAAPWEPGLVARIHFAGGDQVASDTNYGPLKPVWSSPEALAVRTQTLNKLDRFLDVWLPQRIVPGVKVQSMRPLLADLYTAEWQLDLRQPAGDTAEFSLAVHLSEAQTATWLATLQPVVEGWRKTSPAHHGQVVRSGSWLIFQLGNSAVAAPAPAIRPLKAVWMAVDVDWTRLAVWYPGVAELNLPQTKLELTGRSGNIQMVGKLSLAHPLGALPAWQFPTNLIHSPFLSITAVRGISGWLQQQPWVMSLGINPLPDQLFTWVGAQSPFQVFAATPMAGAQSVLPKLQDSATMALHDGNPMSPYQRLNIVATNNQISLTGLPWMAPYAEAVHEASGEFLLGGCFPNVARGKPVPPALIGQLNHSGVVYYHWEATGPRLKLFPQLYQLVLVISRHQQLDAKSAAGMWLENMEPILGPSVSAVTEDSPTELTFTRQATAGLTAFELVAFASWLEAPNFPGCDLRLPPPHRPIHHPAGPGAPPFLLHH